MQTPIHKTAGENNLEALRACAGRYTALSSLNSQSQITKAEFGTNSCALCGLHYDHYAEMLGPGRTIPHAKCNTCPIRHDTGVEGCTETPYHLVLNARDRVSRAPNFLILDINEKTARLRAFQKACRAEAAYLDKLLLRTINNTPKPVTLKDKIELLRSCAKAYALRATMKSARQVASANIDMDGCSLCHTFDPGFTGKCVGCPIAESTGKTLCRDTPHGKVKLAKTLLRNGSSDKKLKSWQDSCQAMSDWLSALADKLESEPAVPKAAATSKRGRVRITGTAKPFNLITETAKLPDGAMMYDARASTLMIKTGPLEVTFINPHTKAVTTTKYASAVDMRRSLTSVNHVATIETP